MTSDSLPSQPARARVASPVDAGDTRLISALRLVLSAAAVLAIYADPATLAGNSAPIYAALSLYTLYSAALYLLAMQHARLVPVRHAHWFDAVWYTLLIGLSGGTSSVFFFFYFFAILVASFRRGFATGLRVTVVSTLLFTAVGLPTAPTGPEFELARALLRPVYLLVLGYMMAHWGGYEVNLRRRMELLREVSTLSNPRFGVEHTLGSILRKVLAFYGADFCQIVLTWPGTSEYKFLEVRRDDPPQTYRPQPVPHALTDRLLPSPPGAALLYNGARGWRRWERECHAHDTAAGRRLQNAPDLCASLASVLEADAYVSVPLRHRGRAAGRFNLVGGDRPFSRADVDFLLLLFAQVMPVLENVQLLDHLASNAAEQERRKIARDIHDSVIQPYIGLQYKVAAIRNKAAGGGDVQEDIEQLLDVATSEIGGLRRYVRNLKDEGGPREEFVSGVRALAERFRENYGINVEVELRGELNVSDRLSAELYQLINEGLSNVRRHTEAESARVTLSCRERSLTLEIENENGGQPAAPFVPKSINERAGNLGGYASVNTEGGRTVVRIEIAL